MTKTDLPDGPIRILVSSCLLGEKVRYDGGHKRDPFLVETLGRFVEYVPVCPEVECGLPTPREAMRLAGDPADPRLVTSKTGVDHTGKMQGWIRRKLQDLDGLDLCGYICKKDSPSSGMERVKVYGETGIPAKVGAGMFTKAFMDHFPLIPVEEEGRLQDPALREMFVERVFTLRRLRDRPDGQLLQEVEDRPEQVGEGLVLQKDSFGAPMEDMSSRASPIYRRPGSGPSRPAASLSSRARFLPIPHR